MQQSSNTAGEQLWEGEAVYIFMPKRVILQIWTVKIWQREASDLREGHYVQFVPINMKA